ncbi:CBS domain-containing protein [Bdellovibrionota bacterium FG-2]
MNTSIEAFIHRKVVVMNEEALASDAARAMRDHSLGCVLVSGGDGELVGIVTDRDLAVRLAAAYTFTSVTLSKIMTQGVVCASAKQGLGEILELMERHGVRRIPIVDSKVKGEFQKCIGFVTLDDLLASSMVNSSTCSRIVRRQLGRQMGLRLGRDPGVTRMNPRSVSRSRQTLSRFYKDQARKSDIGVELIPQVTHLLLGAIVQRMTCGAASKLIAQLPRLLQDSLLRLRPGPDRSLTAEKVIGDFASRFELDEGLARQIAQAFYAGLQDHIDAGEIENVLAQLPRDFRDLFESRLDKEQISELKNVA